MIDRLARFAPSRVRNAGLRYQGTQGIEGWVRLQLIWDGYVIGKGDDDSDFAIYASNPLCFWMPPMFPTQSSDDFLNVGNVRFHAT